MSGAVSKVLVTVKRQEDHLVELNEKQVVDAAKEHRTTVLQAFAEESRQLFFLSLARGMGYTKAGSSIGRFKIHYTTRNTHELMEVDGEYDYHNNVSYDKQTGIMTAENMASWSAFENNITKAVTNLGG
jgi:hypothetical protein